MKSGLTIAYLFSHFSYHLEIAPLSPLNILSPLSSYFRQFKYTCIESNLPVLLSVEGWIPGVSSPVKFGVRARSYKNFPQSLFLVKLIFHYQITLIHFVTIAPSVTNHIFFLTKLEKDTLGTIISKFSPHFRIVVGNLVVGGNRMKGGRLACNSLWVHKWINLNSCIRWYLNDRSSGENPRWGAPPFFTDDQGTYGINGKKQGPAG